MGCANQDSAIVWNDEIALSPALTDLKTVAVGSEVEFFVQVDHSRGGSVQITGISVTGDAEFTTEALLPIGVGRDETYEIPFRYAPEEPGLHYAVAQFSNTGHEDPGAVDLRAQALAPDIDVFPRVLDFGIVAVGESAEQTLTLRNEGRLDADVILEISYNTFSVANEVVPLAVGEVAEVTITTVAATDQAYAGQIAIGSRQSCHRSRRRSRPRGRELPGGHPNLNRHNRRRWG